MVKRAGAAYVLFVALIACFSFGKASFAATTEEAIRASGAGVQQQQITDQFRRQRKQSEQPAGQEPALIQEKPVAGVVQAPFDSTMKFRVSAIDVVNGLKAQDASTQALVSLYLNRDITFADLKELADKITRLYSQEGYLTTSAYVPEQEIKDRAKITVAIGKIGTVSVQGNKFIKPETLERLMKSEPEVPFRYGVLRNDLLRINRSPDRLVEAALTPGKAPQTSDVLLTMKEDKFPMHGSFDWSNTGNPFTSVDRFGFNIWDTNTLGFDDQLSGRFVMGESDRIYAVSADYNIPWPHSSVRFGSLYNYSRVHLGNFLKPLEIQGYAYQLKPYTQFRLADNDFSLGAKAAHLQTDMGLAFDFKDIRQKLLGSESGKDVLRVQRVELNFQEEDAWGVSVLNNEFSLGIPRIFGAMRRVDPSATRVGGGGQFFKYRGSLLRVTRLPWSAFWMFRASTLLSQDMLVSAEQFYMGGSDSVRGYQEGEYPADVGFTTSNELRVPVYLIPQNLEVPSFLSKKPTKWYDVFQMVGFVDQGFGKLHNPELGSLRSDNMLGIGLGGRATLGGISGRVDWGFPLGQAPIDGKSSHFYFMLRMEFP